MPVAGDSPSISDDLSCLPGLHPPGRLACGGSAGLWIVHSVTVKAGQPLILMQPCVSSRKLVACSSHRSTTTKCAHAHHVMGAAQTGVRSMASMQAAQNRGEKNWFQATCNTTVRWVQVVWEQRARPCVSSPACQAITQTEVPGTPVPIKSAYR